MTEKDQIEKALKEQKSGKFQKAETLYKKIIQDHKDSFNGLHLYGVLCLQQRRFAEAVGLIKRAIYLKPDISSFYNNLGLALKGYGDLRMAAQAFGKAHSLDPKSEATLSNLGELFYQVGEFDRAQKVFKQLLNINPKNLVALLLWGDIHRALGSYKKSVEFYERAQTDYPEDLQVQLRLIEGYEKAGLLKEAMALCLDVLETHPDHPHVYFSLAKVNYRLGQIEEAKNYIDKVNLEAFQPNEKAIILQRKGLIYEGLGLYNEAWQSFYSSNKDMNRVLGARPKKSSDTSIHSFSSLAKYKEFFTKERASKWNSETKTKAQPVFFVGFPRSGTTLIDQILAAHPEIGVLEEKPTLEQWQKTYIWQRDMNKLDQIDADTLAKEQNAYLDRAASFFKEERFSHIVDKLPLNVIHLGLINRFFPHAKVIMALRDPRDVIVSCYSQMFNLNQAMSYFLDLKDAAEFYDRVMDLYQHYKETLTLDFIEVKYESVLDDMQKALTPVLKFMGLDWHKDMLRYREQTLQRDIFTPSYEQVVKPIYDKSKGRWTHYQNQLKEVLPTLEPWVKKYGYF